MKEHGGSSDALCVVHGVRGSQLCCFFWLPTPPPPISSSGHFVVSELLLESPLDTFLFVSFLSTEAVDAFCLRISRSLLPHRDVSLFPEPFPAPRCTPLDPRIVICSAVVALLGIGSYSWPCLPCLLPSSGIRVYLWFHLVRGFCFCCASQSDLQCWRCVLYECTGRDDFSCKQTHSYLKQLGQVIV